MLWTKRLAGIEPVFSPDYLWKSHRYQHLWWLWREKRTSRWLSPADFVALPASSPIVVWCQAGFALTPLVGKVWIRDSSPYTKFLSREKTGQNYNAPLRLLLLIQTWKANSWTFPRIRTCGTKSPGRSEALRLIDSAKSPSTKIDGSLVDFRHRLSNRHGRPRRMLIWTFEGNTDRTVGTSTTWRDSHKSGPQSW